MKKLKILLPVIAFLFSVNNLVAQSSGFPDYVPTIPADRRVDWHNVGDNQIPTSFNKVFNVLNYGAIPNDGADDRLSIQNAIDSARSYISANSGSYVAVYLPQGIYNFSSGGISLVNDDVKDYSNICLKGDGSDKTKLYFPNTYRGIAIHISGRRIEDPKTIIAGFHKGDNTITLNGSTQDYNIGDYVEIVNDFPLEWGHKVGQINKVIGKTGTQLILEDKLSLDYDFGSSLIQVRKLTPIKNVGIEDLIIEREDAIGEWSKNNTIEYNYAAKCWILGVESFFTLKHHVDIHNSTFIEIRGCYFHHAKYHGGGGEGYGVIIENHSTNCLVEDNLFDGLRHSMLVQSGANRNVFGYNHSWNREWEFGTATPGIGTADISIHGNYPYANLFEGNLVELIWADDYHGVNGPYNTFVRNQESPGIFLNSADYSNAVGNNTLYIGVNGGPIPPPFDRTGSANVLDVAATSIVNGSLRTHYFYYLDALYQLDCICKDFSYYLDDFPTYFLQYSNVTWPPLGTATAIINDLPGWPGGTIPAYERRIAGGKLTLNGTPLPFTNNITFQNYFIGVGNMGNINVSANPYTSPTNSFSVTYGDSITATAVSQTINNITYYFSNWSTGSTNITETFYPISNTTITANFVGIAAQSIHLNFEASNPRQPITLHWDEYPNDNVTQYQIWRKVKYKKQPTGSPVLLATVDSETTSYIDYDFMGTNLGFTDWMLWYDVRSYYVTEETYPDPYWTQVFSGGLGMEKTPDIAGELSVIKENSLDNYPNPFNPSTIIKYQIVKAGHVTLKVYDMLGREVANLVDKEQPSGRYNVNFNASKLSSGIYLYRITANGFMAVKKMILLQ